jgi:preprotein translocase subunit SecF
MKIDWIKYRWFYFGLSFSFLAIGGYSLITRGLKLGLDFTGGSLLEVKAAATVSEFRRAVEAEIPVASLQQSAEGSFIIRSRELDSAHNNVLTEKLKEKFGGVETVRFETIGPVLGRELIQKTLIGLSLAIIFILFYLAYRFRDGAYGVCAVLAMLHDSLIILGVFSLLGLLKGVEADSLFVTAVLTNLSFSVHDTIVLYDRIREDKRLYPQEPLAVIANRAINETMVRSINNSLTIIFMLLSLFILGGETIRWFVLALLVGTISGTYSSPFVAVPLLVLFKRR